MSRRSRAYVGRQMAKLDRAFMRAWRDDARKDQDGECAYCCDRISTSGATADHVIARATYGKDQRNNIVASCQPCNRLKGHMQVAIFKRMIESPRPGEPIEFRLVNARLRINRALKKFDKTVRRAIGAVA